MQENVIAEIVAVFRNIHIKRQKDTANAFQRYYLLHGVALIGVRSIIGVENKTGSPFNIQKSLHVPNLTYDEVNEMYHWYINESGQGIDQEVIDRIFHVTNGQPGLVSWFGELLTVDFNEDKTKPLTMHNWNNVYSAALAILPNNNIINLISKAKEPEHKPTVLELFRTNSKIAFKFEDPTLHISLGTVKTYCEGTDGLTKPGRCEMMWEVLSWRDSLNDF